MRVESEAGEVLITGFAPLVWTGGTFAPRWYSDALVEARLPASPDAARRETVFAVCAAESYLLEFVRDAILGGDVQRLVEFFPPGDWSSITERWKDVAKALKKSGLVPAAQDFGGKTWCQFAELVEMRNCLVHGAASRPESSGLPANAQARPSQRDLVNAKPGFAVTTVFRLIHELHLASGHSKPTWLVAPPG